MPMPRVRGTEALRWTTLALVAASALTGAPPALAQRRPGPPARARCPRFVPENGAPCDRAHGPRSCDWRTHHEGGHDTNCRCVQSDDAPARWSCTAGPVAED